MHTVQDRVDHLEGLVNLFSNFRTSQDNLAADEYEKHNLRFDHTVDLERGVSICGVTRKEHRHKIMSLRNLRDQGTAQARTS